MRRLIVVFILSAVGACALPSFAGAMEFGPAAWSPLAGPVNPGDDASPQLTFSRNGAPAGPEPPSVEFGEVGINPFLPYAGGSVGIQNEGPVTAHVNSVTITGPDADLFSLRMTPCGTIETHGYCAFDVYFDPQTVGPKRAWLEVAIAERPEPIVFPLSGDAIPDDSPGFDLSTDRLDFGIVTAGTGSAEREVTISSVGVRPLERLTAELDPSSSEDFSLDASACTATGLLPSGQTCSIKVTFHPDNPGTSTGVIWTTHSASYGASIALGGRAVAPAKLTVDSARKVRTGGRLKVTTAVTNSGLEPLTGVMLRAQVTGRLARVPKAVEIASLPVGATAKRTIRVPVKKRAKKGNQLTVKISASAGGRSLTSARTVARVR